MTPKAPADTAAAEGSHTMDQKQGSEAIARRNLPKEEDTEGQRFLRADPGDEAGSDELGRRATDEDDDTEGQKAQQRAIPGDETGRDSVVHRATDDELGADEGVRRL